MSAAAAAPAAVFPPVARWLDLVRLVNGITSDKFPLVLGKGKRAFTAEEETQLHAVLALEAAATRIVLDGAAYVFDRAAVHGLKAPALLAALVDAGMAESAATAFATVWSTDSAAFLAALRDRSGATFGAPWLLQEVEWQLSLGMGAAGATPVKDATAVFDLHLRRDGGVAAAAGGAGKTVSVAFDRVGLADFLAKLDTIQQQVDALSG